MAHLYNCCFLIGRGYIDVHANITHEDPCENIIIDKGSLDVIYCFHTRLHERYKITTKRTKLYQKQKLLYQLSAKCLASRTKQ